MDTYENPKELYKAEKRFMKAKINNVWHPVEVISAKRIKGVKVAKVRAVDGTKPFVSCKWSAPFVYDDEGYVTLGNLHAS